METDNYNEIQRTLMALVGHNLFSVPFSPPHDIDWMQVLKEARMQSTVISAFNNYKELPLDEESAENIKTYLRQCTMKDLHCFKNHTYLHRLMEKNGISYCVIKGAASAHYYPTPLMRNMGDVDFFVHPDDKERAAELFKSEGFEFLDVNHQYHMTFHRGRDCFELHFKPIEAPHGEMGEIFNEYWSDICECSYLHNDGISECRFPSKFHHGFILLTHLQSHLIWEGVGLRHLCDWVVFANSFSNEEFVSLFEKKLKRVGIWRLAQLLCLAAVDNLGMPYKEWMGEDRATANELLKDILFGGNFGRKSPQRGYEHFLISSHSTEGLEGNSFVQAIKSVNRLIDGRWKAAKKIPLLYPVGWVFFGTKFLFKRLTGKRKMSFVDTYIKSEQRKELYRKLRLLEPEK